MKKSSQGIERRTGGRGTGAGNDLLTREGGKDLLIAGCIRLWQFNGGAANDAEGRVAA